MEYDHQHLARMRRAVEPKRKRFALRVGIGDTTAWRIESGMKVKDESVHLYLGGLGLTLDNVRLDQRFGSQTEPEIILPNKVHFRPMRFPTELSDDWRRDAFGVIPMRIAIHGSQGGARIDGLRMTMRAIPDLGIPQIEFHAKYWVRIDNAKNEDDRDDDAHRWLKEYSAYGQTATVHAVTIPHGDVMDKEILFSQEPRAAQRGGLSWQAFSNFFTGDNPLFDDPGTVENADLIFDLFVTYGVRLGTRSLQKSFGVPISCLRRGFTATRRNRFGLAQYLQLRRRGGNLDVCKSGCCGTSGGGVSLG